MWVSCIGHCVFLLRFEPISQFVPSCTDYIVICDWLVCQLLNVPGESHYQCTATLPWWSDRFDEAVSDLIPITNWSKAEVLKKSSFLQLFLCNFKDGIGYLKTTISMFQISRKLITGHISYCDSDLVLNQRWFIFIAKIPFFKNSNFFRVYSFLARMYILEYTSWKLVSSWGFFPLLLKWNLN